ncbi:MAG: DUF3592 domain-containing protein [Candidatus Omnitrophota bacterium]|nr:DUF3592 domain-containing protein [Candidatus Omnitrophota bacterium]
MKVENVSFKLSLASRNRLIRMRLCVVLGVIFLVIAVILGYRGYEQIDNGINSSNWPSVEGRIIFSKVDSHLSKSTGEMHTRHYEPDIRYRYIANGIEYSGKNLQFIQDGFGKNWSERKVNEYPVAKVVKVFYKPQSPELSVLESGGSRWWTNITILIALAFALVFILLAYACYWDYRRVKNAHFDGKFYYI